MERDQLATALLSPISCADCEAAHASGGPSKCPFITEAVAPNKIIYKEGSPADAIWFVRSGVVHLSTEAEGTTQTLVKGDLIGLDCLVSEKRLSTATSDSKTELCSMSKRALIHWLGGDERRLKLILDGALNDPALALALDEMPRCGR